MSEARRRVARLAGASAVALLAWLAFWFGLALPPVGIPPVAVVVILWLPIAPAIPAIVGGSPRAATWCSLVGVFYAGFAMMELVANPPARIWAAMALLLCVAMIWLQLRLIRLGPAQPR